MGRRWVLMLALWGCEAQDAESEVVEASTESITVPSGALDLVGTLHLPARNAGDAVPAVVIVHGSGPVSAAGAMAGQLGMGFGTTIPVYRDLARQLAARGVAVVRYDKRSCGAFNGCSDNAYPVPSEDLQIGDFFDDAVAVATWLADHPAVDAERVGVVGHSQGGGLVPAILSELPTLSAGVSLGGPASAIDVLLDYQADWLDELLEATGVSEAAREAEVAPTREAVAALDALRQGTWSGDDILGAPAAFWASWLEIHDALADTLIEVDAPVVSVIGDYDWNVPVSELDVWQAAFDAVPDVAHRTVELACVSHALNCIAEPDWTQLTTEDIGTDVHTTVVDAIVGAWGDG